MTPTPIASQFVIDSNATPQDRAAVLGRINAEVLRRADVLRQFIQAEPNVVDAILALAAMEPVINQPALVRAVTFDGRRSYHADAKLAPLVVGTALRLVDPKAGEAFITAVSKLREALR